GHKLDKRAKNNRNAFTKANLSNKLYKTVAFGTFVNLQEFMQKSLMNSAINIKNNIALEMFDSSAIYIRKQKYIMGFENILEDHINELCMKYEFIAVMKYDENKQKSSRIDITTQHEQIYYGSIEKKFVLIGTINHARQKKL
ncbi:19039_t:CDS:2, partial [Gigaspora rosea]